MDYHLYMNYYLYMDHHLNMDYHLYMDYQLYLDYHLFWATIFIQTTIFVICDGTDTGLLINTVFELQSQLGKNNVLMENTKYPRSVISQINSTGRTLSGPLIRKKTHILV